MTSCVRILSTSTIECPSPSLLIVNPDGTKFLVNCGEGCQRLMLEHQQKLSTVVAVCCPILHHSSIMGLPGWILTSGDVMILKHKNHVTSENQPIISGGCCIGADRGRRRQRDDDGADSRSNVERESVVTPTATHSSNGNSNTPLLNVYGPRGMQRFVQSLHHFMKPKLPSSKTTATSKQPPPEAAPTTTPHPRLGPELMGHADQGTEQQGGHHASCSSASPTNSYYFGNVRVFEGPTKTVASSRQSASNGGGAAAAEKGRAGPSCSSRNSTSNNNSSSNSSCGCGFDRFDIQCYAFDDDARTNHENDDGAVVEPVLSDNNKHRHSRDDDDDDVNNDCALNDNEEEMNPERKGGGRTTDDERCGPGSMSSELRREWSQQQLPQHPQQLSFLFTSPQLAGKFRPDRAAQLGVPRGPLLGLLKAGQSVTFTPSTGIDKKKNAKKPKTRRRSNDGDGSNTSPNPSADSTAIWTTTVAPTAVEGVESVSESNAEVTVHPWQVVEPDSPGVAILVLHYDTHHRLERMRNSKDFIDLSRNRNTNQTWRLEVVVHMTPDSSWTEEVEHEFSTSWPDVEHVWLSTDPTAAVSQCEDYGTPFRAAALGAATRHAVSGSVYRSPMPLSTSTKTAAAIEAVLQSTSETYKHQVVPGRTMMEFMLIPRAKRGWATALTPSPAVHDAPEIVSASRWIQEQVQDTLQGIGDVNLTSAAAPSAAEAVNESSHGLGELYFTGTGSAIPCKHRNVTGMCVRAANGNRMLLDVGEGTIGHLLRAAAMSCGDDVDANSRQAEPMSELLASIRAVWISHSHADHHLGLLRLLQERRPTAIDDPVLLIAPTCIFRFLKTCEEIGLLSDESESADGSPRLQSSRYRPAHCWDLVSSPEGVPRSDRRSEVCTLLASIFGWTGIQAVPVDHCPNAFAVVLDGTPFGRLVYSGDCRPSSRLAEVASPADVLVHEATFEDGMEDEAKKKKHSTVGEALGVAEMMNASYAVLTHFSQRYPRIPPLTLTSDAEAASSSSASGAKSSPTVVFAFDYMSLTPDNLVEASQLTDVLRLLYPTDEKEEE